MANVVVSAIATFNGKGLKKGQKELSAFDKQAQKLGRTFSRVFAATTIIAFSKRAVNAFAADEKAAKSLAVQLENTGNAFRVNEVESYIASLQSLYGILDDQLRPAFQTLLNATGSITLSQQALETALNVSAGTGKDLASVVAAIAKGATGTTTALQRLGTGLDKATLASGDMNKIMAALDAKFKGQALARLNTYAGKMSLLQVASADATETIGKGLVDALTILSKDNSIQSLSSSMENFANNIALATVNLAKLVDKLGGVTSSASFKPALLLLGAAASAATANPLPFLAAFGAVGAMGVAGLATKDFSGKELPSSQKRSASRLELKTIKDGVFYRKQENDLLKKKTAVDQLRDKFDLERIGLTAALNAATDAETKLRIRAQLAILDNNEALAKKLLAEMEGKTATEELTKQFYALSEAAKQLLLSFGVSPSQIGPGGTIVGGAGGRMGNLADVAINNPSFGYSRESRELGLALGFTPAMSMASAPQEIKITVDTSAAGDKLSQAIAETIQIATRNGFSTVPAGQGF